MKAIVAAALASVVLVCVHLAAGGGDYDVAAPPDPCAAQAEAGRDGTLETVERVGLTALGAAACELGVSRERLLLSLARGRGLPDEVTSEQAADAFRAGLGRAVDAEQDAGRLSAGQAILLRQGIQLLPVERLVRGLFEGGL